MRLVFRRLTVPEPSRKARGWHGLLLVVLTSCGAAGPAASDVARARTGGRMATPSPPATTEPPPSGVEGPAPRTARPRLPEVVLDPKQPQHPLPELKVENIGLHIGGGPNDADTKAPFLSAVARHFPEFMDCYRKSEEPGQGGRFGVDLHIARGGGRARLEQPRTALRGAAFRACLSQVFESVEFERPKRGPTTLSYSLRFTLVDTP